MTHHNARRISNDQFRTRLWKMPGTIGDNCVVDWSKKVYVDTVYGCRLYAVPVAAIRVVMQDEELYMYYGPAMSKTSGPDNLVNRTWTTNPFINLCNIHIGQPLDASDTDTETDEDSGDISGDADAEPSPWEQLAQALMSGPLGPAWRKGTQMYVEERAHKRACTSCHGLDVLQSVALSNSYCDPTPTQQTSKMVTHVQSPTTSVYGSIPLNIASVKVEPTLLSATRKRNRNDKFTTNIAERVKCVALNKQCSSTFQPMFKSYEQTKTRETTLNNDIFTVETIKDMKHDINGVTMFLIGWEGYDSSEDTWEPLSNLQCDALLSQFLRDRHGPVSV